MPNFWEAFWGLKVQSRVKNGSHPAFSLYEIDSCYVFCGEMIQRIHSTSKIRTFQTGDHRSVPNWSNRLKCPKTERFVWISDRNFCPKAERLERSNVRFFRQITKIDRFMYKFFYDHLYSERPITGRPVWRTGRKYVRISNVRRPLY